MDEESKIMVVGNFGVSSWTNIFVSTSPLLLQPQPQQPGKYCSFVLFESCVKVIICEDKIFESFVEANIWNLPLAAP